MITLHGRTVVPGYAEGEALVSPEPISGWGGIDPATGTIIEPRHALHGVSFAGKVLEIVVKDFVILADDADAAVSSMPSPKNQLDSTAQRLPWRSVSVPLLSRNVL